MKVKEVYWFTGTNCTIGIVVGEDAVTGKHKGYIGTVPGRDEQLDAQHIAERGSPVDPRTLTAIANYLTDSGKERHEKGKH